MKVAILKRYVLRETVYFNYGDDYEDVIHNLSAIEKVKEMSEEEFLTLKKAVSYFNNSDAKRDYVLFLAVVAEDEEYDLLMSDFKAYEKKAEEKMAKARLKVEAESLARKAKLEASKKERLIKKLMKELNVSREAVNKMLEDKK
jgi:hypothetical protein